MSAAESSNKTAKRPRSVPGAARTAAKRGVPPGAPKGATKGRRNAGKGPAKRTTRSEAVASSSKAAARPPSRSRRRAADRPLSAAKAAARRSALLRRKISKLALKIPGTRLEALINELYDELERAGITFKPKCYLADEWGCPNNVPVIGIPFYLADRQLSRLEGEITGIEAEDETEILMYLRHEAGHAFNYAYRLYTLPKWQRTFGSYRKAYHDDYNPTPFSTRYVRNVPGWYSQKHPDEDLAETFAVFIRPDSNWRESYSGSPALRKLLHVEHLVRRYGRKPPLVGIDAPDSPFEQMNMTLAQWYASPGQEAQACDLPTLIDEDLRSLFPDEGGKLAARALRAHRRAWVRNLHHWTGMNRHLAEALFEEMLKRTDTLRLRIESERSGERIADAAIFLTTLAMNYQYTGKFAGE